MQHITSPLASRVVYGHDRRVQHMFFTFRKLCNLVFETQIFRKEPRLRL